MGRKPKVHSIPTIGKDPLQIANIILTNQSNRLWYKLSNNKFTQIISTNNNIELPISDKLVLLHHSKDIINRPVIYSIWKHRENNRFYPVTYNAYQLEEEASSHNWDITDIPISYGALDVLDIPEEETTVKKPIKKQVKTIKVKKPKKQVVEKKTKPKIEKPKPIVEKSKPAIEKPIEILPEKRKRGRPRKNPVAIAIVPKRRGRPHKNRDIV